MYLDLFVYSYLLQNLVQTSSKFKVSGDFIYEMALSMKQHWKLSWIFLCLCRNHPSIKRQTESKRKREGKRQKEREKWVYITETIMTMPEGINAPRRPTRSCLSSTAALSSPFILCASSAHPYRGSFIHLESFAVLSHLPPPQYVCPAQVHLASTRTQLLHCWRDMSRSWVQGQTCTWTAGLPVTQSPDCPIQTLNITSEFRELPGTYVVNYRVHVLWITRTYNPEATCAHTASAVKLSETFIFCFQIWSHIKWKL